MAGRSASLFPLVITSSFISITGVEQLWARTVGIATCAVDIATKKKKKMIARNRVEIAQERGSSFFITKPQRRRRAAKTSKETSSRQFRTICVQANSHKQTVHRRKVRDLNASYCC